MNNKILLCGCGWLGKYLASHFRESHSLWGTTRAREKFTTLTDLQVAPLQFSLGDPLDELIVAAEQATVILNIPPGRKNTDFAHFTSTMCELVTALFAQAQPKQVIFISTTAVYGGISGHVDEQTPVSPLTRSGHAHHQIEQSVVQQGGYVLRLSGLVGPDRHPVNSLAGRTLSEASRVVNLVHVYDVVNGIEAIMQHTPRQKILLLSSSDHPMRGEYYPELARQFNLNPITFTDDGKAIPCGKVVNSSASLSLLNIQLQYASPWQMCPSSTKPD